MDPDAEKLIQKAIDEESTTTFDTRPHTTYLKLSFLSSMLYFSIVSAIKVSILLLYRRIFSINYIFRIQSTIVLLLVSLFWLAVTIATLLNCRPLKYSWIGLSEKEHCIDYNIFWMTTGATEIAIDTIILALPIRMVLLLQLSVKRKVSVVLVFLLGGLWVYLVRVQPICLLKLITVSSSQVLSGSFTDMHPAVVGYPRTPAPISGHPPTLAWRSYAPACRLYDRSSHEQECLHRLILP